MFTSLAEIERNALCVPTHPILKWAGGKSQLLDELLPMIPVKYGQYIEPFFGGGALFFALAPARATIADSNPELINLYKSVANNVCKVIQHLKKYKNSKEEFYAVRSQDWHLLSPHEAAARTIYLNRTCFNGLYRVNKSGQFNAPFGYYKNPKIIDEHCLVNASAILKSTTIICADYKEVLDTQAREGDFIFLDPPYLPISAYSDFKRYTKEQFYEEDHLELASLVHKYHDRGCHIILTNSNHPLVHDKYSDFSIKVVQTKRYISCRGNKRTGEDVIVSASPKPRINFSLVSPQLTQQVGKYPSTRFMGSKHKLLSEIWSVASQFQFETVLDLFSGSGVVGYMMKCYSKAVTSNDHMTMSSTFAKAMIENNKTILPINEALALLDHNKKGDDFVSQKFAGLYFTDEDNQLIDVIRANIKKIKDIYKKNIAMTALIRACLKKRPRGIFTYIGNRYNDGRKDLSTPFREQFLSAVNSINESVFDNGKVNKARNGDAMTIKGRDFDLVYIDPPYYSPYSDNEYVRRYHFLEGLARDWRKIEIQEHTITKKFKSYPTPFSTKNGAVDAFDKLFKMFASSILIISYSSNSLPTQDEMLKILARYKKHVDVIPVSHRYSFGNQGHLVAHNNCVTEYLFVGY